VVTLEEVAAWASELPEVTEGERHGHRTWFVAGKAFAWHRPFSKADVKRFGSEPVPSGDILAVTTEDLEEKEALLQAHPTGVFTIPHFDGYAAVLVRLDVVAKEACRTVLEDGWLAVAPAALAEAYVRKPSAGR
jgi:hypothetical protein